MARTRITKAQKEMMVKKEAFLGWIRGISAEVAGAPFLFPEAAAEARKAQDALVDLAGAIGRIGKPQQIPAGPIARGGE